MELWLEILSIDSLQEHIFEVLLVLIPGILTGFILVRKSEDLLASASAGGIVSGIVVWLITVVLCIQQPMLFGVMILGGVLIPIVLSVIAFAATGSLLLFAFWIDELRQNRKGWAAKRWLYFRIGAVLVLSTVYILASDLDDVILGPLYRLNEYIGDVRNPKDTPLAFSPRSLYKLSSGTRIDSLRFSGDIFEIKSAEGEAKRFKYEETTRSWYPYSGPLDPKQEAKIPSGQRQEISGENYFPDYYANKYDPIWELVTPWERESLMIVKDAKNRDATFIFYYLEDGNFRRLGYPLPAAGIREDCVKAAMNVRYFAVATCEEVFVSDLWHVTTAVSKNQD